MPDPLRVSVIIPAFQAEKTLGAAISSALVQTYPNVEVIVCDDGSTDRTATIAAAYGDSITVITQANGGVASARNRAIRACRGDLIALLDADDMWLPNYLQAAVGEWQRLGGGRRIICSNGYYVSDTGLNTRHRRLDRTIPTAVERQRMGILERNFVNIFTVFPRPLYEELGGFDADMRSLEDYDFWLHAIFSGWHIHFQRTPTAFYRRHEESLSHRLEAMERNERRLLQKVAGEVEAGILAMSDEERRFLAKRHRSDPPGTFIRLGEGLVEEGCTAEASAMFARAWALSPSQTRLLLKATLLRMPLSGRVFTALQDRRRRQR